ncbi:MAG: type I polyketide synthase, partial [Solirubrobacterales bacterium]
QTDDAYVAEIGLDETEAASSSEYVIHPALFDSALHALFFGNVGADKAVLPFSFSDVWGDAGASATIRVLLKSKGNAVALTAAGPDGKLLFGAQAISLRPIDASQISIKRRHESLFTTAWKELPRAAQNGSALRVAVLGAELAGAESFQRFDTIEALKQHEPAHDVVLAGLPDALESDGSNSARDVAVYALSLIQEWLAADQLATARLALVTRGAFSTSGGTPNLAHAAAVGLIRTAQSEHPGRFMLIDTEAESTTALVSATTVGEDQLALRGDQVLVPRLTPAVDEVAPGATSFDKDGTVLVTGGTGSIGSLIARHLASHHGVKHLLLTGRKGADAPNAPALASELRELGATPEIVACDVSDRQAAEELLASISADHPLQAVIHAAGVIDDGLIETMTPERIDTAMAPKAVGAWNLHVLTKDIPLRQFVSFSSTAGVVGSPAQSNYSAANAYLDSLAQLRQGNGLSAVSIAWGLWDLDGGMAAALSATDRARIQRAGNAISAEHGLKLFDTAMEFGQANVLAADLDRSKLRLLAEDGLLSPFFEQLVRLRSGQIREIEGSLYKRLEGVPSAEHALVVLEAVREQVAAVLGQQAAELIDPDAEFRNLGFDSLSAVEFRNRLSSISKTRLPATLVFDYPTVTAVAKYLQSVALDGGDGRSNLESGEASFRNTIASIPMARFRDAGLIGMIEELANGNGAAAGPSQEDDVDSMDAATLISRTMGSRPDEEEGQA